MLAFWMRIDLTQSDASKRGFVPASVILQELHDRAPTCHVTLQWLLGSLHQQSFGMVTLILAIVAVAPGISILAGLLLLFPAFQMMVGRPELRFPNWMVARDLPAQHVGGVMRRAISVLACCESAIYPRFRTPPEITKRVVGAVVLMLTVRLLLMPFPLSNIPAAILIAFISLAYVEQDGLLLILGLLGGCVLLILDLGMTGQLVHWLTGLV